MQDWDPAPLSWLKVVLVLTPVSFALAALLTAFIGNREKGALAASLLLILTLLFGPLRDGLALIPGFSFLLFRYIFLLPCCLLFFLTVLFLMRKWQGNALKSIRFCSIYLLVLIAFQLGAILWKASSKKPIEQSIKPNAIALPQSITAHPDVFFIVFDSRTSSKALESFWQYNDSSLLRSMEQSNFHVLKGATSNYKHTTLSILSILNMQYAEHVIPMEQDDATDEVRGLRQAVVPNWFKSMGYRFINLSPFTVSDEPAFYNLGNAFSMSMAAYCFYQSLPGRIMSETLLNSWISQFGPFHYWAKLPEQNLRIVAKLNQLIQDTHSQPRFVYAHVFMPHAPYAFRHDGKKLAMSEYMSFRKDDKALYLEQLRYANLLIAQIAQQLSNKDAVVIIQGDHGFRHLRGANQQEESFMILNAVKPTLAKAYSFPSQMTPVNAFRVILNNEFGASIPLLKDSIIPE